MPSSTGVMSGALVVVVVFLIWQRAASRAARYPPGPKPLPIVGNVLDLTIKELWITCTEWSKRWGEICYVHVLGQGIVFLNTFDVAVELLDKRGAIYSDKPALVFVTELCGCEDMPAFKRYGEQFRRQRKLMMRAFGAPAVQTYQPMIEMETRTILNTIASDPSHFMDHIRRYTATFTLAVIYGYEVKSNDDALLKLSERTAALITNEIISGGGLWPVDVFPALKHLPLWMPGAGFKRKAAKWKDQIEEWADYPYRFVADRMRAGDAVPSFCSTLLQSDGTAADDQQERDIKWIAVTMFGASIETTLAVIAHFILAMALHPEVRLKARKEIEEVIGSDRLPSFHDREKLPYVECVMSECMRYSAASPLGLPHRLMEDDVYDGKLIPGGSLVFANIWAISRDENTYPNPDAFNPERFMEKVDEQTERRRDPRSYVYGFGRRRCPGANLADSSIWLFISSALATLEMAKSLDARGKPIEPEIHFDNSIFRLPNQFKCDIKLRPNSAKMFSDMFES